MGNTRLQPGTCCGCGTPCTCGTCTITASTLTLSYTTGGSIFANPDPRCNGSSIPSPVALSNTLTRSGTACTWDGTLWGANPDLAQYDTTCNWVVGAGANVVLSCTGGLYQLGFEPAGVSIMGTLVSCSPLEITFPSVPSYSGACIECILTGLVVTD